MKKIISLPFLFSVFTLMISSITYAEIAVIVHPSVSFNELDSNYVSRLFLGKTKRLPGGEPAIPINQDKGSNTRINFNKKLLSKNESEYKAYWSRLMFTGKATPPKDSGDDAAIIKIVSANPNIIGYIDASNINGDVKIVLSIP